MNKTSSPFCSPLTILGRTACLCSITGAIIMMALSGEAQTPDPTPIPTDTPVANPTPTSTPIADPTPDPTATSSATPAPMATPAPGGPPQITLTPGVPSLAATESYNAARTPNITIAGVAPVPEASMSKVAASNRTAASVRPTVRAGGCTSITLRSAPNRSRSATSTSDASTTQPIATVTLSYNSSFAGQAIWVHMMRGGTLSATDESGKSYDGSQGLVLQLDANGSVAFTYQAPNASGTYQLLTRFSNVLTPLNFVVPNAVP